jgi:hypothetical protein
MSIAHIARALAVTTVAVVLAATTYGADAARPAPATHAARASHHAYGAVAPVPHKYRASGLRMGLHCDSKDMSVP